MPEAIPSPTREVSGSLKYTPEQMLRALSHLTADALLLPDSLRVPLYARGDAKPVPRAIVASRPQPPELVRDATPPSVRNVL